MRGGVGGRGGKDILEGGSAGDRDRASEIISERRETEREEQRREQQKETNIPRNRGMRRSVLSEDGTGGEKKREKYKWGARNRERISFQHFQYIHEYSYDSPTCFKLFDLLQICITID